MASINDLPDLALAHILLYASDDKLLNWINGFPSVCRRWQEIMPFLWSKVDGVTYFGFGADPKFHINISGIDDNDLISMHVPDKCSKIIKGFEYIVSRCPKSAKLKLSGFWYGESMSALILVLSSELCSELKRLELEVDLSIAIDSREVKQFISCFRNLTNLQEIELMDLADGSDENKAVADFLMKSVLTSCGTLKSVMFDMDHIIDVEVLNYLTKLPNLETVGVDCFDKECTSFSDLIDILVRCSDKLINVSLWFPISIIRSGNIIDCRNSMLQLAKKRIRSFSLRGNREELLVGFDKILSTLVEFKYLNELFLSSVDLSSSIYPTVLQHLPLIKLRLSNVQNLNDTFLNRFKNGLPMLEKLEFFNDFHNAVGTKPSSECLVEFLAKCQRLEKFELGNKFINGSAVAFVRLLHAWFHTCGANYTHVMCGFVFKMVVIEIGLQCIAYDVIEADNLKKENICGLNFFLIHKPNRYPVLFALFSKYCQ